MPVLTLQLINTSAIRFTYLGGWIIDEHRIQNGGSSPRFVHLILPFVARLELAIAVPNVSQMSCEQEFHHSMALLRGAIETVIMKARLPTDLNADGEQCAIVPEDSAQLDDDDIHAVDKSERMRRYWPTRSARCPCDPRVTQASLSKSTTLARTAAGRDADEAIRSPCVGMPAKESTRHEDQQEGVSWGRLEHRVDHMPEEVSEGRGS